MSVSNFNGRVEANLAYSQEGFSRNNVYGMLTNAHPINTSKRPFGAPVH